jgi:putative nucleotidyltransferase with HDIG domain
LSTTPLLPGRARAAPGEAARVKRAWTHRLVRILAVLAVLGATLTLFPVGSPDLPGFEVGAIATRDVIADRAFPVLKNEGEIEQERMAAALEVPPVFASDPREVQTATYRFARFESGVREVLDDPALDARGRYAALGARDLGLSKETLRYLSGSESARGLLDAVRGALEHAWEAGVVGAHDEVFLRGQDRVALVEDRSEFLREAGAVVRSGSVGDRAVEALPAPLRAREDAVLAAREIVARFSAATLRYDRAETDRRRDAAWRAVAPGTGETVQKGERIIGRHEKVTPEILARLRSYEVARGNAIPAAGNPDFVLPLLGRFLLVLTLVTIFVTFLRRRRREIYDDPWRIALLAVVTLIVLGAASLLVTHQHLSPYLVPIAFASLLFALLLDEQMALAMTVGLSLLVGTAAGLDLSFITVSLVAGVVAIFSVARVRHRWQVYGAMFTVALGASAAILAVHLVASRAPIQDALRDCGWGLVSAFGSTSLAFLLLPIFESVFHLTTDLTLLELSDLNRPVLRRMMIEAPGTYHHSLIVGSLAEAAAESIGANSLLARVGAYYHDIGKISKPEYFTENQKGDNRHERLTTTMSCLILESHVKEGIDLAKREGLPRRIRAFIPEHHGTALMEYFYRKAKSLDPEVEERDYRYPGPRPQSRETAIVMLADGIEAASRGLEEPTPSRLGVIVKRIVDSRAGDGELDDSPLTMGELATIRETFQRVLVGIYHGRIAYPWMRQRDGALRSDHLPVPTRLGR